jgi:hypothetical protein
MTPTPPALSIRRLIDDNPIDPGPKRGPTAKLVQGPEHTQEHFL